MNRDFYFDYVQDQLIFLADKIESCGKLNLHDVNIHSENFYQHFFNLIFGWNLINLNQKIRNAEAIDLIDQNKQIIVQVSSTATKQKIENGLKKDLSCYVNYNYKFISISKNAEHLRKMEFINPHKIKFIPQNDIYDINSILTVILGLEIDPLERTYDFIKNELGTRTDGNSYNIETNLATVINILAKENWEDEISSPQVNPYEIERKIEHNRLIVAKDFIEEYKIYYHRVDSIYSEFNRQGMNKSKSVLDSIRRDYLNNKNILSDDELFHHITRRVINRIQASINYVTIPFDELELCVNILVVDAFMRCKIFENPEGYRLVTA